jgi:Raf kinase inhibitor-like YbhB/YbcL family protein
VLTCFGANASPPLAWSGVPAAAQSLLLLVYDLDAGPNLGASTSLGFAHWIVYDIPPDSTGFAGDLPAGDSLPGGAKQGTNDFAQFESAGALFPGGAPVKLVGYDGPCPPAAHRYTFTLYALDAPLDLPPAATMAQVLAAMEGHVLAQAQVVGTFAPPG